MAAEAGAWIVFAIVALAVMAFSTLFVRFMQDRREAEIVPTIVAVTALSLTLFTLALLPVDIYNVSSTKDKEGQVILSPKAIESRNEAVKTLYYIFYSFVLTFTFVVVPFAYFYYEEEDEDTTTVQRVFGGCKYTIFLIIIVAVLLILGLVLKPGPTPDIENGHAKNYVDNLVDSHNGGDAAISFAIATLTLLGFVSFMFYTSLGMASLAMDLIRGNRAGAEEMDDLEDQLQRNSERRRAITSKYLSGRKKMTRRDERDLSKLTDEERMLKRRLDRVHKETSSFWTKIVTCLRPFAVVFGILFLLIAIFLVVSLLLTSIDRSINSVCGAACGYILQKSTIFNPFDALMVALSKAFPIDYIVLLGTVCYFFITTVKGISKIGIRFIWLHLYSVKPHKTVPQGILFMVVILMTTLLAVNLEMLTIAPMYVAFGTQMYKEKGGQLVHCNLEAPPGECTMSQLGTFVVKMSVLTPFFGSLFYYLNWAFIVIFVFGTIYYIAAPKSSFLPFESTSSSF